MSFFNTIIESLLLESTPNEFEINDAINNNKVIIVNYHSNGEDIATGPRKIYPVAYGTTIADNEVIRAFEPEGDTTTRVPNWKYMRVDRISNWIDTKKTYTKKDFGQYFEYFNPNDDKLMNSVYNIANVINPKKNDKIYKTNSENSLSHDLYRTLEKLKNAKNIYKNPNGKENNEYEYDDNEEETQNNQKDTTNIYKPEGETLLQRNLNRIRNYQKDKENEIDPSQKPIEKEKDELKKDNSPEIYRTPNEISVMNTLKNANKRYADIENQNKVNKGENEDIPEDNDESFNDDVETINNQMDNDEKKDITQTDYEKWLKKPKTIGKIDLSKFGNTDRYHRK